MTAIIVLNGGRFSRKKRSRRPKARISETCFHTLFFNCFQRAGFIIFFLFALTNSLVSQSANLTNFYYNNFDSALGPGWSTSNSILAEPNDSLGPFGTETVTYRSDYLPLLPCHDSIRVSFKLILRGSWDGNGDHCCGPDIFVVKANGVRVFTSTFSNTSNNNQSYPSQYFPFPNTVINPQFTGSSDNNQINWSTYLISFTFPCTAPAIVVDISEPGSQGIEDEAWYLDDFSLDACRSSTLPSIRLTPPLATICPGDSILLTASGALNYTWSPAYGLSSATGASVKAAPGNSTTYKITGYTTSCSIIDTATVIVNRVSSSIIHQSVCQGESCFGYSVPGIYIDTLVAANGCDSIRTLNLTVLKKSLSTVNQSICEGQSYSGHHTTGIYIDTLVAVNGCDSVTILNLTVTGKPVPRLGPDTQICLGDSVKLFPGDFVSYLWQDNSTADHFIVKQPGVYSVTVSNSCGSNQAKISISEKSCTQYFPTAFTPNKDGRNDIFKILNASNLLDYDLEVYNRLGQRVFITKDYTRGWDGTFKGELQDPGVYIYFCRYKKSGIAVETKGTVILIR
jgi:gliding motility-associated-like protein